MTLYRFAFDHLATRTDPERAHAMADQVLLAAVPKEIRRAYERAVAADKPSAFLQRGRVVIGKGKAAILADRRVAA